MSKQHLRKERSSCTSQLHLYTQETPEGQLQSSDKQALLRSQAARGLYELPKNFALICFKCF